MMSFLYHFNGSCKRFLWIFNLTLTGKAQIHLPPLPRYRGLAGGWQPLRGSKTPEPHSAFSYLVGNIQGLQQNIIKAT